MVYWPVVCVASVISPRHLAGLEQGHDGIEQVKVVVRRGEVFEEAVNGDAESLCSVVAFRQLAVDFGRLESLMGRFPRQTPGLQPEANNRMYHVARDVLRVGKCLKGCDGRERWSYSLHHFLLDIKRGGGLGVLW